MPFADRTGFPDADAARRVISETVPEFGPRIATQARAYAEAVRPCLNWWLWGPLRISDAARLIEEIIGRALDNSWESETLGMLRGFFPRENLQGADGGISAALQPAREAVEQWTRPSHDPDSRPRPLSEAPGRKVRPILTYLYAGLTTVADRLQTGSIARPPLLPALHPPAFARLREDVAAETVAGELAALIAECLAECEAARAGAWPNSSSRQSSLNQRIERSLQAFLTQDVRQRYTTATHGLGHVEALGGWTDDPSHRQQCQTYRQIAADVHHRIYAAYLAIAVTYLGEVLELMPAYAEASGQGPRRDPITIHGNVGAINSDVPGGTFIVGTTVTNAGPANADVTNAVRALTNAVQQAPELADRRAQLLDHLADISEAADTPHEPRKLSRAKAAMGVIIAAASTSTTLAQAVDTWRHVLGTFS
jgi:hypothetical protein